MSTSRATRPALGSMGVLRSGKWLTARAIALAVALIFITVLAFGPALEWLSNALPKQPWIQFLVQAVGAAIVLGTYAVLVRIGERRAASELSLRAAPADLVAGLAIGSLMFSSVMAILLGFNLYRFDYHGPASIWHALGLAAQSAVLEEVLVRGVVLRIMWRAFVPWAAFVLSALLFGAGHVGNPGATWFTTACIAIEAGVMLGAFYALTGRLWVSIGVHASWNLTQGFFFGAAVSGGNFGEAIATSTAQNGFPVWLTGGTFGPEASLPGFLVCTLVGGFVIWASVKRGNFLDHSDLPPAASPQQQLQSRAAIVLEGP